MRSNLILVFISASFLFFQSCSKNNFPATEEEAMELAAPFMQVNKLMDGWHKAAAEANEEAYFGAIADDGYFIGTDASEVWTKQEFNDFAKEYFDRGEAWDFTSTSRNVHFSDDSSYVWFDELLDTWMGPCRGSGILIYDKKKKEYQIKHYVLSLAVPNDKINKVIGVIGLVETEQIRESN